MQYYYIYSDTNLYVVSRICKNHRFRLQHFKQYFSSQFARHLWLNSFSSKWSNALCNICFWFFLGAWSNYSAFNKDFIRGLTCWVFLHQYQLLTRWAAFIIFTWVRQQTFYSSFFQCLILLPISGTAKLGRKSVLYCGRSLSGLSMLLPGWSGAFVCGDFIDLDRSVVRPAL